MKQFYFHSLFSSLDGPPTLCSVKKDSIKVLFFVVPEKHYLTTPLFHDYETIFVPPKSENDVKRPEKKHFHKKKSPTQEDCTLYSESEEILTNIESIRVSTRCSMDCMLCSFEAVMIISQFRTQACHLNLCLKKE